MNDTVLVDKAEENGLKFSKKEGTTEAESIIRCTCRRGLCGNIKGQVEKHN